MLSEEKVVKLSDQLKAELATLSYAKPADQLTASELYSLYRAAGGEIETLSSFESGIAQKATWAVNMADQLSKGFRFIAGVWRQPTTVDLEGIASQLAVHQKACTDLSSLHSDMVSRMRRAEALPRVVELKTLIEDAEAQERIAESLAAGEKQRLADEEKKREDDAALARFRASEAKAAGSTVGNEPTASGKTEILSTEISGSKPLPNDREDAPPAPPAAGEAQNDALTGGEGSGSV